MTRILSHNERCERFIDGYIRINGVDLEIPYDIKMCLICNRFLDGMEFITSNISDEIPKQRSYILSLFKYGGWNYQPIPVCFPLSAMYRYLHRECAFDRLCIQLL